MPCLNESRSIAESISKAKKSIKELGIAGEILIADNGSTDGSIEIAQSLGVRVLNVKKRGYGSALINGIKSSHGKYIIMGDADGTYEWDKIKEIYLKLNDGFDLVMGNRFHDKISKDSMPFLSRFIGNPILSFLGRVFFKIKIKDFHCGLRGFNKNRVLELKLNSLGMEFASEIVIKSALSNFQITEVPTILLNGPENRKPHLRPFRDGWRHLRLLLAFAPLWSSIIPGIILFLSGSFIYSIIFINEGNFFGLQLREHSLIISSALIFLGFSSVLLGLLGIFSLSNYPKYGNLLFIKNLGKAKILEYLLIISFFIVGLGLFFIIRSINYWGQNNFLDISSASLISQISPGLLFILIGTHLLFVSFLLESIKYNLESIELELKN
jgi:glycosyltransferase involved in cell wall biosynthesis